MTAPLTSPARVPILDDNDRLYPEQLPAVPPTGWGSGTSTGGGTVDTLTGTGGTGRDLMKAATPLEARGIIGTPTIDAGTTTAAGVLELATVAEAVAGTDTARAVTPAGVRAAVGPIERPWYPRAGGLATNAVDMVNGTYPPHPVAGPEDVYVYIGPTMPTGDGNRLTGGGGMDVVRQPPDRYVAL